MESADLDKLKVGKNEEQKKVLDYFLAEGCLASKMKDDEYLKLVYKKRDSLNLREKALSKIGLDEDELKEIPPTCIEGFVYQKAWSKQQANGNWVSTTYEIAWLFFNATQIYLYKTSFWTDESKKTESTYEIFYKDVTSVTTKTLYEESKNKTGSENLEVESHKFAMSVPGDNIFVAMSGDDSSEATIQALKQKVREVKNAI